MTAWEISARNRTPLTLCLTVLLTGVAGSAVAQPPDEDCLACHEGPKVEQVAESLHGQLGLACVDCHADLATVVEFPHAERLAPAACTSCHDAAGEAWGTSVHAEQRAGKALAACWDCHGGHDVQPASERTSRANHFNVPATCERCHQAGQGAAAVTYEDGIHAKGLHGAGLVVAPNCATCHGAHDVRRKTDPESRVSHAHVPETCGQCHEGVRQVYETSVHWAKVQAGRRAAVCSDCHSAHAIQLTGLPSWRLDVIRECGTCHEERIRTYRDGFHGKVTSLGYTRVATCNDCHGSHGIRPETDPASKVSPANLVVTCGRCHEEASARFVEYNPHANPENREDGVILYYTNTFMKLLLAGVFSFFGLHTALWLPRSIRERRRRAGTEARS